MPSRSRSGIWHRASSRARQLAALDARSLADLLVAQCALLRAQWQMQTHPIGSLTRRASTGASLGDTGLPTPPNSPQTFDSHALDRHAVRARAIGTAVRRAADFGLFRPFCLVRALAIRALLEREGIRGSEIRIGVRRIKGEFAAHAWVRFHSEVLGDNPRHVATFTEVDDIRVLGRS